MIQLLNVNLPHTLWEGKQAVADFLAKLEAKEDRESWYEDFGSASQITMASIDKYKARSIAKGFT